MDNKIQANGLSVKHRYNIVNKRKINLNLLFKRMRCFDKELKKREIELKKIVDRF